MTGAIDISWWGLSISLVFVLLAGAASLALGLGLGKDLLWGTVRTFAQLYLMAFVLRFVFAIDQWYVVLAVFAAMIVFATYVVKGRVKERTVRVYLPTLLSMLLSYMVVTIIVVAVIVQAQPWYAPKYFIPLGGMVIGNSITAIAVAMERLLADLRKHRAEVELLLCLGATASEASAHIFRTAIRAGMTPSIMAMMGVGVVWIPGMMTGQILAGADPLVAVKYQIMVMIMLVGSTAIGSVLAVSLVRRRCFSPDHRLLI
ncbi:MAG: iron export ABC transporter permease subunit FetB [Ignavibacteria bacterium]|nr:iron export ABC transporter permease subunit FetB [Ignavibacteria bacterium]